MCQSDVKRRGGRAQVRGESVMALVVARDMAQERAQESAAAAHVAKTRLHLKDLEIARLAGACAAYADVC